MAKKSKPPVREVLADDFELEVDGQAYRPHVGEVVRFRGRATVGQLATALDLQAVNSMDLTDPDQARHVADRMREVVAGLAASIVSWTWTDDTDAPYPSPPDVAVLRRLSTEEIGWLTGAQAGGRRAGADGADGDPKDS